MRSTASHIHTRKDWYADNKVSNKETVHMSHCDLSPTRIVTGEPGAKGRDRAIPRSGSPQLFF